MNVLAEIRTGLVNGATPAGTAWRPPSKPDLTNRKGPKTPAGEIPGRILIVEDNPTNRLLAEGMLKNLGCTHIDFAENGQEGVEKALQTAYDIIFMDCRMPVLDGFEATKQIRISEGDGRRSILVAMTASVARADRERSAAVGMDEFIAKPVVPAALSGVLQRWREREMKTADAPRPDAVDGTRDDAIVNLQVALANVMNDTELLKFGVDSFLKVLPPKIAQLKVSIASKDMNAVCISAHTIKGSSSQLWATLLTEAARELEALAMSGSLRGAEAMAERIEIEFARCRRAMENIDWEELEKRYPQQ